MIPFRDNIPARTAPVLTVTLIAINTIVFFFQSGMSQEGEHRFIYRWGMVPASFQMIGQGRQMVQVPGEQLMRRGRWGRTVVIQLPPRHFELEGTWTDALVRLFTSMFLHGNLMHLVGNMWFLWLFGDNVEDRLGRARYLLLYVLSGLAAGVTQVYVDWGGLVPVVGASGAIAGVLGGYMITYPYARVLAWVPFFYFFWNVIELPAIVFLGIWFLMQFFNGAAALGGTGGGGVAYWAHVGGFLAGILLMWLLAAEPTGRRGPRWVELADDN